MHLARSPFVCDPLSKLKLQFSVGGSQQEDCFDGLFLHSAHHVLMSLGLWEGGIITFILTILGRFPSSDVIILSTDKTFWDLCPHSHVLCRDVVDCGLPMHSTVHLKR